MHNKKILNIGTRGSPLALIQARLVQSLLADFENVPKGEWDTRYPICKFKTSGDRLTDRRLIEAGGKGLFTKELEQALLAGDIDIAVHSMKDVPTQGQKGLRIAALLKRADVRDGFISATGVALMDLPKGAVLGTASIRRQAQVSLMRSDLKFTLLRGNVGTRLQRLGEGVCAGTFLAVAGLQRLRREDIITEIISETDMLPAPAQGAIGIEIRSKDDETYERLRPLHHRATHISIAAERAFLQALDGSCRTPIAALAVIDDGQIWLRGQAFSQDGQVYQRQTRTSLGDNPVRAAQECGARMGGEVKAEAGQSLGWQEL